MIGKAILLLLVATVAVQSYVPYNSYDEVALLSASGDSFIDELKILIEQTIKAAKQALDKIYNDLTATIKDIIEKVKTKFDQDLKALLDKIKKIKEEAEKAKVDITECLKDNEEALKNLPKKYEEKLLHCNDDVLNKGKALVEDAKKSVDESIKTINSLIQEFEACGTGLEAVKCRAKVSIKITRAVLELPLNVNKIVNAAVPSIISLTLEAQKCAFKQTIDFATEGRKIFEDFKTCVHNKLHPSA